MAAEMTPAPALPKVLPTKKEASTVAITKRAARKPKPRAHAAASRKATARQPVVKKATPKKKPGMATKRKAPAKRPTAPKR